MNSDYTTKLHAGAVFPDTTATLLSGESVNLAKPKTGFDWKLVLVYRGKHCPLCTRYLNQLEQFKGCLLYTSPSPRDRQKSRMPSSA